MKNIYQSLLLVIAGATQKELASQIKYLKVENEILRSRLPVRLLVTPKERNRLVKFGSKLATNALHQLVSIVHSRHAVALDSRGLEAQSQLLYRSRPPQDAGADAQFDS